MKLKGHNMKELINMITEAGHEVDYQESDLAKIAYLMDNNGYTLAEILANDYLIDDTELYEAESLEALAEIFVDEGMLGEIPDALIYYINYDAIGRDLGFDYTEFIFNNIVYFMRG